MSDLRARVLPCASREARGRAFTHDETWAEPALELVGSARLDSGRDAIQPLDASAPVTGRLLQSASAQPRSLVGRALTMYSALRLPDRSRLGLLKAVNISREVEKWQTDQL